MTEQEIFEIINENSEELLEELDGLVDVLYDTDLSSNKEEINVNLEGE